MTITDAAVGNRFARSLRNFQNAMAQASTLSGDIADRLQQGIRTRGQASIALSGGSTPMLMLQQLATSALDWSKVQITLVDERCVDADSSRSNARLLRENLIDKLPLAAEFYPLYQAAESAADLHRRFALFSQPFDVVHLGMGEDAHTASFFPDADNIGQMLDLEAEDMFMYTQSESSQERRITWTLPQVLNTRYLVIQLCGLSKKSVLNRVLAQLDELPQDQDKRLSARNALPVLAVLEQTQIYRSDGVPASIYYADD